MEYYYKNTINYLRNNHQSPDVMKAEIIMYNEDIEAGDDNLVET